jgi:hypothetical protein
MGKYELTNSNGEIIQSKKLLPSYFKTNSESAWILQFVSSHAYEMEKIKNEAREDDLKNFVASQLELRNAQYQGYTHLKLEENKNSYNKHLSEIQRTKRVDEQEQYDKIARDFENRYKKITHADLSESSKAILIKKWQDCYTRALAETEEIYR